MRRIGISQRTESFPEVGEIRDCLDKRWITLILNLGYLPIPLPTLSPAGLAKNWLDLGLDAVILSGGNNIERLTPDDPSVSAERDAFENQLISFAIDYDLPLLGVCRGMQLINLYFGGSVSAVEAHIGCRHRLHHLSDTHTLPTEVNSFHRFGVAPTELAASLSPLAVDCEGNIEAFASDRDRVFGLMWHPEREEPTSIEDLELLRGWLG